MDELGTTVRYRRQRLGWSLSRLALAAGCSKAYLSAIENHRLSNPPSAALLESLETALELSPGQLRRIADWQTTPPAVQAEYRRLLTQLNRGDRRSDGSMNLDALYQSGSLRRCVDQACGNVDLMSAPVGQVPLINKVAAGYPTDFTDLEYPARIADEYVPALGLQDTSAFAARVVGDSMAPDYTEGDVLIFSPERAPIEGSDCFVRLLPDHHTTFKRIHFEADDRMRLQPLNPAYPVRVVTADEVSGLYPAIMRLQKLG